MPETPRNHDAAFPDDWEVKKLDQLLDFKNGINAEKESYGSGVKFVNVMEVIYNQYITYEMIKGSVQVTGDKYNLYQVLNGDVLFNRTSETQDEIGLTSVYNGKDSDKVVFGGFVIRGRPIGNSLNDYYKRYCFRAENIRSQIIKQGQGAVRANIEQRAIARVLGTWDEAISKTAQLLAAKQQRKKWLMQQLLTGKKRLAGFSEEWKEYALGEMFRERNEVRYDHLPLLSVGQNGIYPQADSTKKDTSNTDKSKYKRICPNDIGYNTMRMWQGRSALSDLEGIVSPAYTIITPKPNAKSSFFASLFKTPKLMNLFWRNSQGLVDDTLNCKFKDFSIIKIRLPEKAEQVAIAEVLQAADAECALLRRKLEALKTQKRGLMQQLLTGKKRLVE
jgi:type I restriction enzyme S subunit